MHLLDPGASSFNRKVSSGTSHEIQVEDQTYIENRSVTQVGIRCQRSKPEFTPTKLPSACVRLTMQAFAVTDNKNEMPLLTTNETQSRKALFDTFFSNSTTNHHSMLMTSGRQRLAASLLLCFARFDASSAFVAGPANILAQPQALQHASSTSSSLSMANKLWDRLSIEEDPEGESFWYLINCVATNEVDLLRQCRSVCEEMPDAKKFVVPLEQKTRSHGAKKMVTETKVKYPGYVFANLRLCPEVYEAIQNLDLCRSWMGTVNHKGYKKLPPVPVALNELEVENFGLDDLDGTESDEKTDGLGEDEQGIILDSDDDDDDDDDMYEDPMYKNIDRKALKLFMGLKVDDMVKVTAKNKFYKEDGIVRRLKEGRIFVRFYTYGTMFEEWLEPSDVRKLTSKEVVDGLTGPAQPITQRDFDEPEVSSFGGRYGGGNNDARPGALRNSLTGTMRGGQRQRRQDRNADRFRQNSNDEQRRNDKNWESYKEQRHEKQGQAGKAFSDDEWTMRPGSNRRADDRDVAQGDVDSQWGRKPQRQVRREIRKTQTQRQQGDKRQTQAANDGKDDWSAFVSSPGGVSAGKATGGHQDGASDDFFASLMTDLNKDLDPSSGNNGARRQQGSQPVSPDQSSEDDFFASLMTELTDEVAENENRNELSHRPVATQLSDPMDVSQDDDFFAALEAELGTALNEEATPSYSKGPTPLDGGSDVEDFFAELDAELAPVPSPPEAQISARSGTKARGKPPASATAAAASPTTAGDLSKNTVPVLKEMLRSKGLKVGGKKAELVERLLGSS